MSPIFSSFITLVLILSILSLVNKFEAISLQFKSEKMQLAKKQFRDQNEKNYHNEYMWNVKSMHDDFCYCFSHNI